MKRRLSLICLLTAALLCVGCLEAAPARTEKRIRILSITLGDGRAVDPSDGRTLYRVATSSFSGTRGGSAFEKKAPLIPADDAPVDCEAFVAVLRAESAGNGGRIPVDTGPRGTLG